jgi:cell division protein FtsB
MHALLRSETLMLERLGDTRRESRQLEKKVKRLRKRNRGLKKRVDTLRDTPLRRARKAAGRALGRSANER